MSYSFPNVENCKIRKKGWIVLIHCLSWKRDSSWGGFFRVHVYLVRDTYIRVECLGKRTTWGRRVYNVSHMVLGLL